MNNVELDKRTLVKSFCYMLSSREIGYHYYKSDENPQTIIISKLICEKCRSIWETSDKECFYCGSKNYFTYRCIKCGKVASITNSLKKCPNPSCDGINSMRQICFNPHCPSNNSKDFPEIYKKSRNEGIFTKGNLGNSIRITSCKKCGHRINKYVHTKIKIVFSREELLNDEDTFSAKLYVKRNENGESIKFYCISNNEYSESHDGSRKSLSKILDNLLDVERDYNN